MGTSSDGKRYTVNATCKPQSSSGTVSNHTLNLGDTTNGLKNNSSGSLEGR